ncbi:MAG TPA: ATP-binding protein [Longimicrobiales bacterium]
MTTEWTSPVPPAPPSAPPTRLLERREQELAFLAEITHVLAAAKELRELLPLLLDRLCLLLRCESAAVAGMAPVNGDLVVLAARTPAAAGEERVRGRAFPRAATLVDRALCERRPIPLRADDTAIEDPLVRTLAGARPGNGMVVPLIGAAGTAHGGLLALGRADPFGPEDLRLLRVLAEQATIAVARAEQQRVRAEDAMYRDVLRAVLRAPASGFDEHALISETMDAVLAAWPVDGIEVGVRDGGELRVRANYRPSRDGVYPEGGRRHRLLHERIIEDGAPAAFRSGPHHAACAPIRAGDRLLGSVLVARRHPPFPDRELDLLEVIGNHLGAGIERARAFRRITTEAHQLERTAAERSAILQQTQEQLARSQWLASLGELAAGVAHDLNNALNPIVAFAELIKEHGDRPAQVRTYAERILMAAKGGAETVRRIQRFTRHRLGALPVEVISLAALVQEAVELSRPTWTKHTRPGMIEWVEDVDPGLAVQGNPGELRQALMNLISNAVDAMPDGGSLRFIGRAEGDLALVAVQDTGNGMTPDVVERALEPFFTTKGVHGTGLGLPEVFGIVRRHGGNLEVESWPGVGTTVLISLPRMKTAAQPAKLVRPGRAPGANTFRILLIDDNLLSLEATAASLRAAGHAVTTAVNAQTALRLFGAGRYDVVLSDLGLPDLNGWELVDQLRIFDPDVRLGVITGWSLPEGDEELTRRGIDLVFVKPVDPEELLAAL